MADPAQLAKLKQGAAVWNAWRHEHRIARPDLSAADLRGLDLAQADLGWADLREADFTGCNLGWARLVAADLRGADLSDAILEGLFAPGADLREARLHGARNAGLRLSRKQRLDGGLGLADLPLGDPEHLVLLQRGHEAWNAWRREHADVRPRLGGADLAGMDLSRFDLRLAELTAADLAGAGLRQTRFTGASLQAANLAGADLTEADLSLADLSAADLRGAVLERASVGQARFFAADLRHTAFGVANQVDEADFRGAFAFEGDPAHLAVLWHGVAAWNAWRAEHAGVEPNLAGANLIGLDLDGVDLSFANLERAQLAGLGASGADLRWARLAHANLSRASLSRADLSHANLSDACLVEATMFHGGFVAAHLFRARCHKAKASDADFSRVLATGADFSKAWLRGAQFIEADLAMASLSDAWAAHADLSRAQLQDARLDDAQLAEARLAGADLSRASLSGATLRGADLSQTRLCGAWLQRADLSQADLSGADLSDANLQQASMVATRVDDAVLSGCRVYGVAAWGLDLAKVRSQTNLLITPEQEPAITVDNLELAQFVYLMLHNRKIRDVIDTVTGKGVLILGRFTDERKAVLDGIRDRLRERNLVPMVFDWDRSPGRDLTETVQLLANLSRFVVADITDAKSIPQELMGIVPNLPSVPVLPIILASQREYAMFEHFRRYHWVLPLFEYRDPDHLLASLDAAVLAPVHAWESRSRRPPPLEDALREKDATIERLKAELAARRGEADAPGVGAAPAAEG
jgi:uncharacterized protein YjbI with pentapeptide repeats